MTDFSGSCSCGMVKYRLASAPMFIHCCHCTDCQRQTGSAFVLNALIETDRVKILEGDTRSFPQPTESGRPHVIHRCPDCGTAVWSNYGGREQMRFVRIGTLEKAREFVPDVHIYTRSKQAWVVLPGDGVGATTGKTPLVCNDYYEMNAEWPAESLARREALFG
ncbi:MAG: GFA family protein [Alphaproteobacteria bacterium]|nr:GFA family protein [Alphaproteobacteria bacterium]